MPGEGPPANTAQNTPDAHSFAPTPQPPDQHRRLRDKLAKLFGADPPHKLVQERAHYMNKPPDPPMDVPPVSKTLTEVPAPPDYTPHTEDIGASLPKSSSDSTSALDAMSQLHRNTEESQGTQLPTIEDHKPSPEANIFGTESFPKKAETAAALDLAAQGLHDGPIAPSDESPSATAIVMDHLAQMSTDTTASTPVAEVSPHGGMAPMSEIASKHHQPLSENADMSKAKPVGEVNPQVAEDGVYSGPGDQLVSNKAAGIEAAPVLDALKFSNPAEQNPKSAQVHIDEEHHENSVLATETPKIEEQVAPVISLDEHREKKTKEEQTEPPRITIDIPEDALKEVTYKTIDVEKLKVESLADMDPDKLRVLFKEKEVEQKENDKLVTPTKPGDTQWSFRKLPDELKDEIPHAEHVVDVLSQLTLDASANPDGSTKLRHVLQTAYEIASGASAQEVADHVDAQVYDANDPEHKIGDAEKFVKDGFLITRFELPDEESANVVTAQGENPHVEVNGRSLRAILKKEGVSPEQAIDSVVFGAVKTTVRLPNSTPVPTLPSVQNLATAA